MAKKFGLGKGIDALLGEAKDEEISSPVSLQSVNSANFTPVFERNLPAGIEADENGQLWVKVAALKPNPHQPRTEFDQDQLQELADSIKEHGILQPVTIEDAGSGEFYIIAGERRTRAAKLAGLEKIPVQLKKYTDQKKLEVALIENIQRADLNAIEEAKAYYQLMEMSGLNQEEVAARVGKKRSTVANAVRLLKLPDDMQEAIVKGDLTAGHARALLSVSDRTNQRILFGKITGDGLSVRKAEELAGELNAGAKNKKNKEKDKKQDNRDPDFIELEQKFIDALGTKVQLKGSNDKGSITIDYFSKSDLDRLYQIIIGN